VTICLVLAFVPDRAARADGAMTAHRITQLYHAYYGFGVADYCGLITWEVNDGYQRRIRYLLQTADIDKQTERWIRISGSVEAMMPLAASKGVELRFEATPDVHVVADPRRLEQVFLNLLANVLRSHQDRVV
jgi:hypothetical protein